jgi:hypothetical protein
MRKAWLSVAGVCAVALLAIQFAWQGDAPVARALDESSVPMAAPATSGDALPAASEPEPALLLGPDVPVEFRGAPRAVSSTIAAAELTPEEQKQVNKLQKKLNKALNKQAKAELKAAKLNDALAAAQAELDAANALDDGPAKDKAVAKATKKLAKLQGKLDKAQDKLGVVDDAVDVLTASIEDIDPDHFSGIDGLQAPDAMDVVTANEDGGGAPLADGGSSLLGPDDFPPTSDFNLDEAHSHVFDTSMEVLSNVDQILCFMAHTAYDVMVNKGTYVAQVDKAQCESGDQDTSENQSSSAGAEQPSLFVVHSARASEDAPEIVSFWVPMDDDKDAAPNSYVRAKMVVQAGVSAENPFGKFKMDFAGVPPGGDINHPKMHGTLQTLDVQQGNIGFSFYESEGDLNAVDFPEGSQASLTQANVNMFADQSQGVARVRRQHRENWGEGDTGIQTDEYLIAFDGDSVMRSTNGEAGQCLSRDLFATNVFRYTLYEAFGPNAGARVERNGGFNIKTADGTFGWAGYYGLWLPTAAMEALHTGDTVVHADFGSDDATPYTVLVAPGHLIRNTRQQLSLVDCDNLSFEWMEFPNMAPPPPGTPGGDPPPFQPPTHWRVVYHHELNQWMKVATLDEASGTWTDVPQPTPIDLETQPFLQMWSQSLGGSVSYVAGDDHITYYKQSFVNPADEIFAGGDDVPLFGYTNCLKGDITQQQAETGDVFQSNSFEVASPHRYLLRKSDMTLWLDEEGDGSNLVSCTLVPGAQPQGGPFQWGLQCGPLLTDTSSLQNTYELWNQDVFYTWETGANSWNKLSMLLDEDGQAVSFDPPLQFSYQHVQGNDANGDSTYAGQTFLLNYNGPGDLWGIPMVPTDLDGDGNPDRFYPQFSIADGVLVGPNGEYVIKGVEKELTLLPADPSLCGDQSIDPVAALPLPDGSEYEAPDIGPKPVIDQPPSVIDGVVQGDG